MSDQNTMTSAEAAIVQAWISGIKNELANQGQTLRDISSSLQILTRLEQGHSFVLDQLKTGSITMTSHDKRLQEIEKQMPGLLEMRRWVVGGIIAGIGMIGVALLKIVIIDPSVRSQPAVVYVSPPQAPSTTVVNPAPAATPPATPAKP